MGRMSYSNENSAANAGSAKRSRAKRNMAGNYDMNPAGLERLEHFSAGQGGATSGRPQVVAALVSSAGDASGTRSTHEPNTPLKLEMMHGAMRYPRLAQARLHPVERRESTRATLLTPQERPPAGTTRRASSKRARRSPIHTTRSAPQFSPICDAVHTWPARPAPPRE